MTGGTVVAGHWYAAHPRTWGPSVSHDQAIGGGLMITLAELVALPFLILVFAEWRRAERVRTVALDARLDREAFAAPEPDSGRPWWETDQGEVGRRMRGR
jgi:putative copper resistance protein D